MLNYHELRIKYRKNPIDPLNKALVTLLIASLLIGLSVAIACAGEPINDKQAVFAIIGEAEGEKPQEYAMLAVACTIRNRGTLKGVYGHKSKRVINKLYSRKTFTNARLAWEKANEPADVEWVDNCGFVAGATGWGNLEDVRKFRKAGWFHRCIITKRIGNHYFYKEIKR